LAVTVGRVGVGVALVRIGRELRELREEAEAEAGNDVPVGRGEGATGLAGVVRGEEERSKGLVCKSAPVMGTSARGEPDRGAAAAGRAEAALGKAIRLWRREAAADDDNVGVRAVTRSRALTGAGREEVTDRGAATAVVVGAGVGSEMGAVWVRALSAVMGE
jgi:hypothetical protein